MSLDPDVCVLRGSSLKGVQDEGLLEQVEEQAFWEEASLKSPSSSAFRKSDSDRKRTDGLARHEALSGQLMSSSSSSLYDTKLEGVSEHAA